MLVVMLIMLLRVSLVMLLFKVKFVAVSVETQMVKVALMITI